MRPTRTHQPFWAYAGTLVGGAASLAANVAHCYIPPTGATQAWTPEPGAVTSAVFWPVALFIAVEILVRTRWPHGRWWKIARFGGLVPVALVAAVVSYRHLSGLLAHYGEDTMTAVAGPAAVDGLMVMAAAALLAGSTHQPPTPPAPTPPGSLPTEVISDPTPAVSLRPAPATPSAPAATARPGVTPARAADGTIPSGVIH